jgi:hypothetical protein
MCDTRRLWRLCGVAATLLKRQKQLTKDSIFAEVALNIVGSKKLLCRSLPALRDNRAWARMPEKKSHKVHYKTVMVGPTHALDWLSGSGSVARQVRQPDVDFLNSESLGQRTPKRD